MTETPQPSRASVIWRFVRRTGRRVTTNRVGQVLLAFGLVICLGVGWLVWPYLRTLGDIGAGFDHQPSRLWADVQTIAIEDRTTVAKLEAQLQLVGYAKDSGSSAADRADQADQAAVELASEHYRLDGDLLHIALPERVSPAGRRPRQQAVISLSGDRISSISVDDNDVGDQPLFLGARLLASYHDAQVREIRPVIIDELPPHVVDAVLAAEDHNFFRHLGLSPSGIARAAIVNAREGEVRQGGSTITQQLIKNVFLTHERSLVRKLREAALSVLVELAHRKKMILQAYLNQIYLGTGHGLNLHGIGSAARHYFGVDARDLTVSQAAVIAGMIRSPGNTTPLRHPGAARERRDQVLHAMREHQRIDDQQLSEALAEAIEPVGLDLGGGEAPYFARAVGREAEERFGVGTLGNRGYHLFTTLSLDDQRAAQESMSRTLASLPANGRLEGALVSADPRTGAVLAWVGGRDFDKSEFDRVRSAHRQAGSAFKPVVLAAALAGGEITPISRFDDSPLELTLGGRPWKPMNSDDQFRGLVTVRRTIEDSLNVPTVRLAQQIGLDTVTSMARDLGIESELDTVPSLALGAFEVTPLELATAYATLAAGGQRPTLHVIAALVDADGNNVGDAEPPASKPVLDAKVAYQVTSILRGVVERGTATGATSYSISGSIAGKTGTSNDAIDNWFAAYRPDRVTVVWVGHDEPKPTPLSGARAAVPLWGRYAAAAYPKRAPAELAIPTGLVEVSVCRDSGLKPVRRCPIIEEALADTQVPDEPCDIHSPSGKEKVKKPVSWIKKRWKKIFG